MHTTLAAETEARPAVSSSDGAPDVTEAGRLVVLVPDVAETALLAARIHEVAEARRQQVLLLGVASESQPEASMRRKLTLLAAFLKNAGTLAEIRVKERQDWLTELGNLLGARDVLACCASDAASAAADPWIDLLGRRFRRPIYVFMDAGSEELPRSSFLAELAPWVGSVIVILGFLWLQIRLSQGDESAATTAWLVGSVPAEIGLIWLVNSLLG